MKETGREHEAKETGPKPELLRVALRGPRAESTDAKANPTTVTGQKSNSTYQRVLVVPNYRSLDCLGPLSPH